MAKVFIALGGNQGDRAVLLRTAQGALWEIVVLTNRSPVYETAPKYVTDQPPFLNMVVEGHTELKPDGLLKALKATERNMGRVGGGPRNGPRPIDLDILFYDDLKVETETLTIPHPRIAERRFVLQPLADIAQDFRHPVTGETVAEMLAALPDDEEDVRVFEG